jgi:hypothetical chaperone protein
MRSRRDAVGIDFGTTNSSIAIADGSEIRFATFAPGATSPSSFRSVLYFEQQKLASGMKRSHSLTGPGLPDLLYQLLLV